MRKGELLGLGWGDVDFDSEAVTIRHALPEVERAAIDAAARPISE